MLLTHAPPLHTQTPLHTTPTRLHRDKEAELFEPMSVAPWLTLDKRLGCLAGHLDPSQCFSAELYAVDVGVSEADDVKLNFGEEVLRGLFHHWMAQRNVLEQQEEEGWAGESPVGGHHGQVDTASLRTTSDASQLMGGVGVGAQSPLSPGTGVHDVGYVSVGTMCVQYVCVMCVYNVCAICVSGYVQTHIIQAPHPTPHPHIGPLQMLSCTTMTPTSTPFPSAPSPCPPASC